jgi:hypothetical protein
MLGAQDRDRSSASTVRAVAALVVLALTTGTLLSEGGWFTAIVPGSGWVMAVPVDDGPLPAVATAWHLDRTGGVPVEMLLARAERLPAAERRMLEQRVIRVADRVAAFDWRAHGVDLMIGCAPVGEQSCPIGVAIPEGESARIVLSPLVAYLTDDALATVIAHELAHVWQFSRSQERVPGAALAGLKVPRPEGTDPAELEADCLAAVWGFAPPPGVIIGYWACPPRARIAVTTAWRAAPLP